MFLLETNRPTMLRFGTMVFTHEELRLLCCSLANREEYLLVREVELLDLLGDPKLHADSVKNTALLSMVRHMTLQTRLLKARFEAELPHELDSRGVPSLI